MTDPNGNFHPQQDNTLRDGVSLREWLAGMALIGLTAAGGPADAVPQIAVNLADDLIARLNQPKGGV